MTHDGERPTGHDCWLCRQPIMESEPAQVVAIGTGAVHTRCVKVIKKAEAKSKYQIKRALKDAGIV